MMLQSKTEKVLVLFTILILLLLWYSYFFGESGVVQHQKLKKDILNQREVNAELNERNRVLFAQVDDLKTGSETIEEYARLDLGLIKPNETFVQMSMIDGGYQQIYLDESQKKIQNHVDADTVNTNAQ